MSKRKQIIWEIGRRKKKVIFLFCFYLWRAFEVHARHWKSSNVHGDAPVEVERPDDKTEASTNN